MAVLKKKTTETKPTRKQQVKQHALFLYEQYRKKKSIISKP
jgi:hypothetical protein